MANRSSVSALVERSPRASIRGRNVAVGSRVSTRTREAERSELVRWAILVGAGVFATTFAQPAVLKLPLQYLLKSDLHVSRDAMAAFFAAGALAWYFKPLAGILSDSVPLFGTRRRHYLLLSGVAAGGLWLLIGTLSFFSGAFGLVGAFLYGVLCRRLPLRWLLALGIALSALGTLGYLFYRSGMAAALIEGENGLLVTLAELALMDLAARATPRGSEGLGFALMMSVRNAALAVSDIFGSWLIERHQVSFFSLVWLNAGTTALVLLAVAVLARGVVGRG